MTYILSQPVDVLAKKSADDRRVKILIIGSGYGAAMAALRLSDEEENPDIWVMERGREYALGEFPKNVGDMPGYLGISYEDELFGQRNALFDLKIGENVSSLVGSGLGGTSLINGGVSIDPPDAAFDSWPERQNGASWSKTLKKSADTVKSILGVVDSSGVENTHPDPHSLGKVQALDELGKALDVGCSTPVPLAINFQKTQRNVIGRPQAACVDCGNCITGCNNGAKNTLAMNVWPLVESRGVKIFTSARVSKIEPSGNKDYRWKVTVVRTQDDSRREVAVWADNVILAAGTFGSTELLLNSGVTKSPALGEYFSVNGDLMGFSYRRREPVNAFSQYASVFGDTTLRNTGPLTVAEIRVSVDDEYAKGELSLQDAGIPYPMRRVIAEVMSMGQLVRLFGDGDSPETIEGDLLAVDQQTLNNSVVFTCMGREPSYGSIRVTEVKKPDGERAAVDPTTVEPVWDFNDGADFVLDYVKAVEDTYKKAETNNGHNGGLYIPSPPWRLLPEEMLDNMDGMGSVEPHLLTTHPLGGCRMGLSGATGVVNENGQVFSGAGTDVLEGLYVMDGSIVPGPIGVNPLMTISQLTYHLADRLAGQLGIGGPTGPASWNVGGVYESRGGIYQADPNDSLVESNLQERFFLDEIRTSKVGGVTELPVAQRTREELRSVFNLKKDERLVMDVSTVLPNLEQWLGDPGEEKRAEFTFYKSSANGDTVPTKTLQHLSGPIEGTVSLGKQDHTWFIPRLIRQFLAFIKYLRLRGGDAWDVIVAKGEGSLLKMAKEAWKAAKTTYKQSVVMADYRLMQYKFNHPRIKFFGQKRLAYRNDELDPLNALRAMRFNINGRQPRSARSPLMRVDMIRFMEDLAPFATVRSPSTPEVILQNVGIALFFVRMIVQTHFWSFGAPSYERRFPNSAEANKPRLKYGAHARTYVEYESGGNTLVAPLKSEHRPDSFVGARLLCYSPVGVKKPEPILLIHGLAHGGEVFLTDTVNVNMTQYLLSKGYEVWILDHRLSININDAPAQDLSIDDIARDDIPWAVSTLYKDNDSEPCNVFAHCIGAGAFQMSLLSGRLQDSAKQASMIKGLVIHAVPPWLEAAEDNRWRANAVSLFRTRWDEELYDPIPHNDPDFVEMLGDRFAFSFGWDAEDARLHKIDDKQDRSYSKTICDRMTLFYGDEWVHANLDPRTHLQLDKLVGPAPVGVLRQAFYCIVKGRLTAKSGWNEYLSVGKVRRKWTCSTLFLHGSENKVFDVESSRKSRLCLEQILGGITVNVEAFVQENFGHMDMLFGKDAADKVFPVIDEFLTNQRLSDETRDRSCDISPISETSPPDVPRSGPIISNPRVTSGGVTLDIWTETSSYCEQRPEVNYYDEQSPGMQLPKQLVRKPGTLKYGMPAGIDNVNLAQLNGRVGIGLSYGGISESTVEWYDWQALPWYLRLEEPVDEIEFIVGSCLYPGSPTEALLSDGIFKAMTPFIRGEQGRGVSHMLLVGDQIYADATAELFDPIEPMERFQERYQRAFGGYQREKGQNAHWVMSHLPTYFAVDDHEFEDNWPKQINESLFVEFPATKSAEKMARVSAWKFLIHQSAKATNLWYDFESDGFPFFVFDTRMERNVNVHGSSVNALLSKAQQQGFINWLAANKGKQVPLTIVTGSPLGPIHDSLEKFESLLNHEDTLVAYPGFIKWLYKCLADQEITSVVLISGDNHQSSFIKHELSVNGGSPIIINQVISSGLYAPLPFVNRNWDYWPKTGVSNIALSGIHLKSDHKKLCRDSGHFAVVSYKPKAAGYALAMTAVKADGNRSQTITHSI